MITGTVHLSLGDLRRNWLAGDLCPVFGRHRTEKTSYTRNTANNAIFALYSRRHRGTNSFPAEHYCLRSKSQYEARSSRIIQGIAGSGHLCRRSLLVTAGGPVWVD
ncbi:hypothetical protein JMJ77_0007711 [Colletotrichum scovillei]|uniref:Uncharacterized protein n=1 Tax=Colletotrichum scovillei TaxID=1209932 RepID=A0A9P7RFT3_9PEZI|nr:hypothetical protein JMJ77_0007711 [Colletotrichum scovillei]KAG7074691.1 hypothetical protein JMJ76_0011165 [Colletotrichum scovillei]KAG7081931.1 hypothetical protein JMJ78_0004042 [Colletotrichum scovillei]